MADPNNRPTRNGVYIDNFAGADKGTDIGLIGGTTLEVISVFQSNTKLKAATEIAAVGVGAGFPLLEYSQEVDGLSGPEFAGVLGGAAVGGVVGKGLAATGAALLGVASAPVSVSVLALIAGAVVGEKIASAIEEIIINSTRPDHHSRDMKSEYQGRQVQIAIAQDKAIQLVNNPGHNWETVAELRGLLDEIWSQVPPPKAHGSPGIVSKGVTKVVQTPSGPQVVNVYETIQTPSGPQVVWKNSRLSETERLRAEVEAKNGSASDAALTNAAIAIRESEFGYPSGSLGRVDSRDNFIETKSKQDSYADRYSGSGGGGGDSGKAGAAVARKSTTVTKDGNGNTKTTTTTKWESGVRKPRRSRPSTRQRARKRS